MSGSVSGQGVVMGVVREWLWLSIQRVGQFVKTRHHINPTSCKTQINNRIIIQSTYSLHTFTLTTLMKTQANHIFAIAIGHVFFAGDIDVFTQLTLGTRGTRVSTCTPVTSGGIIEICQHLSFRALLSQTTRQRTLYNCFSRRWDTLRYVQLLVTLLRN